LVGVLDYRAKWPELSDVRTAIVPVGSIEQHGHHLPVGTDMIIAEALARGVAERVTGAWALPCIPFSQSFEHAGFAGSVSLRATTLCGVMRDVLESLQQSGIEQALIVNAHGGNHLLRNVVQEWNALSHPLRAVLGPARDAWARARQVAGATSSSHEDMHGGEAETSLVLHLLPQAVELARAADAQAENRELLETYGMTRYSASGVIGFPTRATQEKGRLLLVALVEEMVNLLAKASRP
jgi:creatinine amidohydrolase